MFSTSVCRLSLSKNMSVLKVPLLIALTLNDLNLWKYRLNLRVGIVYSIAGDVGANDFPTKIVDATVQCVSHTHFS